MEIIRKLQGEIPWLPVNRIIALGKMTEAVVNGIVRSEVQLQFFPQIRFTTARQLVRQWSEALISGDRVHLIVHVEEMEHFLPDLFSAIHTRGGKLPYITLYLIMPTYNLQLDTSWQDYLSRWIGFINQSVHRLVFVPLANYESDGVIETRQAVMNCLDVMPVSRGTDADNFSTWMQPAEDMGRSCLDDRSLMLDLGARDQRITADVSSPIDDSKPVWARWHPLMDDALQQLIARWKIIHPYICESMPTLCLEDTTSIFSGFTAIITDDSDESNSLDTVLDLLRDYLNDDATVEWVKKTHKQSTLRLQLQGILICEK